MSAILLTTLFEQNQIWKILTIDFLIGGATGVVTARVIDRKFNRPVVYAISGIIGAWASNFYFNDFFSITSYIYLNAIIGAFAGAFLLSCLPFLIRKKKFERDKTNRQA